MSASLAVGQLAQKSIAKFNAALDRGDIRFSVKDLKTILELLDSSSSAIERYNAAIRGKDSLSVGGRTRKSVRVKLAEERQESVNAAHLADLEDLQRLLLAASNVDPAHSGMPDEANRHLDRRIAVTPPGSGSESQGSQ